MTAFNQHRFAVIADIHSNADALTAVLRDIDDHGVDSIINLGDHLSGPMAARETADLLMARDMILLKGNHDRWLTEQARDRMDTIEATAFDQLEAEHIDWVRQMPATQAFDGEIFACHGTPRSDTVYWTERVSPSGDVLLRSRDEIAKEAEGIVATLFLCGHTHLPRRVDLPDGRVVLNPGSVGCPAYTDNDPVEHIVQTGTAAACYALVERTDHGWMSTFRHIAYDPQRMIEAAKAADHAHWEPRLATGWIS